MSGILDEKFDFLLPEARGRVTNSVNKVYFVCHEEKYAEYYKMIADDVFQCSDNGCIIYRKKDASRTLTDEETSALGYMKLFVVAVTKKLLLEKESSAMREIEFALREKILILPFIMEENLEFLYGASVLSKRQWVNPVFVESNALPYREKLCKFFAEHFLGNKQLDSIKAEFSARIFLSYRKKDRSQAQPLMRAIHTEPRLRDVAIWYDEYLPLAEDFSDSIDKEIDVSDAVAFLVTENLTEKGNYVKSTEYPAAVGKGKTLLPLEPNKDERVRRLVKKDFDEEHKGCAFPECVEVDEIAEKIDIRDIEDTPTHKHFIGMAYMYGVDLERDAERGVALLKESAEAGNVDSAVLLSVCYRNGICVGIDYAEAIFWCKKAVGYYESAHDKLSELRFRTELTALYKDNEDIRNFGAEARRAYSLALEVEELDGNFPAIVSAKCNYLTYLALCDEPEVLSEAERTLGNFEQILGRHRSYDVGESNLRDYHTYKSIAMAYKTAGKIFEARELYALSSDYAVLNLHYSCGVPLGEGNPAFECMDEAELKRHKDAYLICADAFNSESIILERDGNYEEALTLGIRAFVIRRMLLGTADSRTRTALYNYSIPYYKNAEAAGFIDTGAESAMSADWLHDDSEQLINLYGKNLINVSVLPYAWVCPEEKLAQILSLCADRGRYDKIEALTKSLERAMEYFTSLPAYYYGLRRSAVNKLVAVLGYSKSETDRNRREQLLSALYESSKQMFSEGHPERLLAESVLLMHRDKSDIAGIVSPLLKRCDAMEKSPSLADKKTLVKELSAALKIADELVSAKLLSGNPLTQKEIKFIKALRAYKAKLEKLKRQ